MAPSSTQESTPTTSTINIIVVGAGLVGPRHAAHVAKNERTNLFAIVDMNPKVETLCNDLHTNFFQSLEDMVGYCRAKGLALPEAAIICTPNHTHIEVAAKLANYGINMLIEKPVGSDPKSSKALETLVQSKGLKVLVGHHRRFNPFIMAAKKHIPKVGKVIAVQGTWALKKPPLYFEESPWRASSTNGGGATYINLVHDLDLMQYLFGRIIKVFAEPLPKQRDNDADEGVSLTMRFQTGVSGTFICSDNAPSPFNFESSTGENPTVPFFKDVQGLYRVFGTEGTLSIPDFTLYKGDTWLKKLTSLDVLEDKAELFNKPFDSQLDHFIDMLTSNVEPLCTIDDGISALLVIEAVKKSMDIGNPVMVTETSAVVPDFSQL